MRHRRRVIGENPFLFKENPQRRRNWAPPNRRRPFKVGDRVQVTAGGTRDRHFATVVRWFDWRLERGAYKIPPKGYVYLKDDNGDLFTMPPNYIKHSAKPLPKPKTFEENPLIMTVMNPSYRRNPVDVQYDSASNTYEVVRTNNPGRHYCDNPGYCENPG